MSKDENTDAIDHAILPLAVIAIGIVRLVFLPLWATGKLIAWVWPGCWKFTGAPRWNAK